MAHSIYYNDRFIRFGGVGKGKPIFAYSPVKDEWTKLGDLLNYRTGYHNVLMWENEFLVVGGVSNYKTDDFRSEKCVLDDDKINCSYQNPDIGYGK